MEFFFLDLALTDNELLSGLFFKRKGKNLKCFLGSLFCEAVLVEVEEMAKERQRMRFVRKSLFVFLEQETHSFSTRRFGCAARL